MQKVSWFLRVSAVSALALILAAATLGTGAASAAIAAATAAPTTAAAPIVPVCVAAKTISEVRVVHASPNSPNVDIYVDKGAKPTLANVKFGEFTPYMGVVAGVHHVTITKAGDAKTIVFDQDVKLGGQLGYTLIAEGTLANFSVKVLVDDLSDTAGMARITVVHAVSDGPAVDVITTADKKAVVSNLAFPNSVTMSLDVVKMAEAAAPVATPKVGATAAATPEPTGFTVDLAVTAHGSTAALVSLPKTKLEAGSIYTVIAIGLVGDKTNKAVPIKVITLVSSPFVGFQAPPAPPAATPEAAAATAAAPAATAAAPAATAAATKSASVDEAALAATPAATAAATAAAPVPTKIPVGQEPASAGLALRSSTLRRVSDNTRCVTVNGITVAGGPADVAGIKAGDFILSVDGTELTDTAGASGPEAFQAIVSKHKSGDKLKLELQHADGSQSAVTLELGLNPFS